MTKQDKPDLHESIEDLDKDLEKLDDTIDHLDRTLEKSIKSHGFLPTFLRGVIGAVGAAIGGALVIAILVYVLQGLTDAPFVGGYVDKLLNMVQQNK